MRAKILAEHAAKSAVAVTKPDGTWESACAYIAGVNKADKNTAEITATESLALAGGLPWPPRSAPSCGAGYNEPNSNSELGSCHSSDREKSESGSAADSDPAFIEVLVSMDSKKLKYAYGNAYTCFSCPNPGYKVDSAYGSLITVKIPYDSRTALEIRSRGQALRLLLGDPYAAIINFKARWVTYGSSMVEGVT